MEKREFQWASLCALLIVALNRGMNIWLRIAVALNSIALLISIIGEWRALRNGGEDEAEDENLD